VELVNPWTLPGTLSVDTIINGKTYYKVITSGTLIIYDLNLGQVVSVEPYSGPMAYIREEQNDSFNIAPTTMMKSSLPILISLSGIPLSASIVKVR
jgi:hypothetical protein